MSSASFFVKLFTYHIATCHIYIEILLFVLLSATVLLLRRLSSGTPCTDVNYDQLKQLLNDRKSIVIDVREPWELREYGSIPGSINVPCECHFTQSKLVAVVCLYRILLVFRN